MLGKLMVGGLAAAVLALMLIFSMLLDARQANGALISDIDRVATANARQLTAIEFLKLQSQKLVAQVTQRELRAWQAAEALTATELAREGDLVKFQASLAKIREKLSAAEIVCADDLVPAAFIDSLHDH